MTKIRKTSLLSGAAIALFLTSVPVHAQEMVKQPISGWAVTKVDPEGQGASYCALARKYTPDIVLTIARNARDESSIAIDFQRATFNTGRDVSVTLDAGNNQTRLFDSRPISRSAVVLRTGTDNQFFQALRGTRSLTADIDGNKHRFVMPDIEMGLSQLTNCLGGSRQTLADIAPLPKPITPDLSAPMETHQSARLAALQDRLERLENENTAVNNDRTSTDSMIQAKLSRLEAEKLELSAQLESERARYREELASGNVALEQQLAGMESQLSAIEADKREQLATAQAEIERIEAEKKGLLTANRVAMASAQEEIDRISDERDSLMSSLEKERADYDAKIAKGQQANSLKIEELQASLSQLESRNKNLLNENEARQSQLSRQLDDLKVENETLQVRLREERDQYQRQLVSSTDERDKKLAELQGQLDDALDQNKALEQSQTQEIAQLQAEQAKLMDMQARLEAAEAEKQQLQTSMQQRIAELQDQKQQLIASQDEDQQKVLGELDALQARNAELAAQLEREREEYRATLSDNAGSSDSRIQTLMEQLSLAETRNETLSTAMQANDKATQMVMEKTATASNSDLQAAQVEQMELKAMLEAEKARRQRIEQILNSRGQDNGGQQLALTEQLAKLKNENNRLKTQLDNRGVSDISASDLSAMQNALQAKDRRIASVERDREDLMNELQAERENFRNRLRDQAGQAGDQQLVQTTDKLAMLEQRNESLMRALQEERMKEAATVPAGSNDSAMRAERDELRVMLESEKARRERLEQVLGSGVASRSDGRSTPPSSFNNQQNTRLVSDLNGRISQLEQQNQDLARALASQKAQQAAVNSRPAPVASAPRIVVDTSAQKQLTQQSAALSAMRNERDRLRQQLASVQGNAQETRELVDMRQRLRAMEQRNQEMARSLAEKANNVQVQEASLPVPQSKVGRDMLRSNDLAEVQNALEIALAERDEYQALLQRERARLSDVRGLKMRQEIIGDDAVALNDMIRTLEAEKVKLVRALEHEKARKGDTPVMSSSAQDQEQIAMLKAERDTLRAALETEQKALENKREDLIQEQEQVNVQLAEAEQDVQEIRSEQQIYSRRLRHSSLNNQIVQEKNDEIAALKTENQLIASELAMQELSGQGGSGQSIAGQAKQGPAAADKQRIQRRFEEAERENIRLAQELAAQRASFETQLAQARSGADFTPMPSSAATTDTRSAMDAENIRLSQQLAQERAQFEAEIASMRDAATPAQAVQVVEQPTQAGDIIVAEDAPKSALQRLRERIRNRVSPATNTPESEPSVVMEVPVVAQVQPEADVPIRVATNERNAAVSAQPLHVQRLELDPPASAMEPIIEEAQMEEPIADETIAQPELAATTEMSVVNEAAFGPDGTIIRNLLQGAGVSLQGGLQQVAQVATPDFAAFRWDTGAVYGSAEQSRIANPYLFENFMEGYLRKTESRCGGVFDKSASGITYVNELPVASYDIACITNESSGDGAGAAILFFMQDGLFNVVAHEGGLMAFEEAMTTRDRLSNTLIR